MNVHQPEVEILPVAAPVRETVVILEPVGTDDTRDFQESEERVAQPGGAFLCVATVGKMP